MSTPIESMRSIFTESEEALRKAKEELEKDKDAIDKANKFLLQDVNYQRLKLSTISFLDTMCIS